MDQSIKVLIFLMFAAFSECASAACIKENGWEESSAAGELAIVSRNQWGARPPTGTETMRNPVPYVIIHHSYIPGACDTPTKCEQAMRSMQNQHQNANGWADIGYSFGVGGDGRIYMGRGWSNVGAHAPSYNDKSIGICFIGDWTKTAPPKAMLDAGRKLIAYGVSKGYIVGKYQLYGHRQVRDTECPGDAFFDEISHWPNWHAKAPYKWTNTTTSE